MASQSSATAQAGECSHHVPDRQTHIMQSQAQVAKARSKFWNDMLTSAALSNRRSRPSHLLAILGQTPEYVTEILVVACGLRHVALLLMHCCFLGGYSRAGIVEGHSGINCRAPIRETHCERHCDQRKMTCQAFAHLPITVHLAGSKQIWGTAEPQSLMGRQAPTSLQSRASKHS